METLDILSGTPRPVLSHYLRKAWAISWSRNNMLMVSTPHLQLSSYANLSLSHRMRWAEWPYPVKSSDLNHSHSIKSFQDIYLRLCKKILLFIQRFVITFFVGFFLPTFEGSYLSQIFLINIDYNLSMHGGWGGITMLQVSPLWWIHLCSESSKKAIVKWIKIWLNPCPTTTLLLHIIRNLICLNFSVQMVWLIFYCVDFFTVLLFAVI